MISAETKFYQPGGTLRPGAPCYVERQADRDLHQALLRGEFCYVLTSRQMGKSSLMAHTAARLRQEGVAVATVDFTMLGQNLSPEQWYASMLDQISEQLGLEDKIEEYWTSDNRHSPLHRWLGAFRHLVLEHFPGRVVLFVDEIDSVRSLPFRTDEFFAALRGCYNRRNEEPEFERLVFCLLGVATPSDLIADTRTTPFNVGRRIELTDFSSEEAAPLARGLERPPSQAAKLLKRVLYWTAGHPYLTQRLCEAVAEEENVTGAAGVDRLCQDLFLSHGAQERDDNLLFVRDRLLKSEVNRADLLNAYQEVRRGRRALDGEPSQLIGLLRLSGIAQVENGRLRVRNRIYGRIFDARWVITHLPNAELRRQRAALVRGRIQATVVVSLFFSVIGVLMIALGEARHNVRSLRHDVRSLRHDKKMILDEAEKSSSPALVRSLCRMAQSVKAGGDLVAAQEYYERALRIALRLKLASPEIIQISQYLSAVAKARGEPRVAGYYRGVRTISRL